MIRINLFQMFCIVIFWFKDIAVDVIINSFPSSSIFEINLSSRPKSSTFESGGQ